MFKKISFCFGVFVFLIVLGGCRFIILKMYGIKDPEVENRKSITKAANKFALDTSHIASLTTNDYLQILRASPGLPDAAIFDSDGKYIEYRKTDTSCNAGLFQFIPELTVNGSYNKTGLTDLSTEIKKLRSLSGTSLNVVFTEPADFYVLIYTAVYLGKLNKDHVKAWEQLAKQNKNCYIKVINVNADLQAWWYKSSRDSIIKIMEHKK